MLEKKLKFLSLIVFVLILLAVIGVYWQGLNGPFLLDDQSNIVKEYISTASIENLRYAASHNTSGLFSRAIPAVSFAISGLVHGPEPWGYKFDNLLLHLAIGVLICIFLIQILPLINKQLSLSKCYLISIAATSAWLLHPLMVSTVLYAVQRMAQFSAFFSILSLIIYVSARKIVNVGGYKYYVLSYLCFPLTLSCALLSKENGALIPVFVVALEFIVFEFFYENSDGRKRVFCFLTIFVLLPISVGLYYIATHFSVIADYGTRNFSLPERLMTELHVVIYYLKLIILPRLSDMGLYHDYTVVVKSIGLHEVLLIIFYGLAVVSVFYTHKRAKIVSLGVAWFLIAHLMESTFIDLELVFEHRNYLALLGLMLVVFYYSITYSKLTAFVASLYIIGLGALTSFRAGVWGDLELLYAVTLHDHPESIRVHTEYANYRYNLGFVDEAYEHLDIAQTLQPKDIGPTLHKILYRCANGESVKEYLPMIEDSLRQYPPSAYTLNGVGILVVNYNEKNCTALDTTDLLGLVWAAKMQKGSQANPLYLGFLSRVEGQLYFMRGDYEDGVEMMLSSYEITKDSTVLVELAEVQIAAQLFPDAEETIEMLREINIESFGREESKIKELDQKIRSALEK